MAKVSWQKLQNLTLKVLEDLGGECSDPEGFASRLLADLVGTDTKTMNAPLRQMEADGLILRDTIGRRTYSIRLSTTIAKVQAAAGIDPTEGGTVTMTGSSRRRGRPGPPDPKKQAGARAREEKRRLEAAGKAVEALTLVPQDMQSNATMQWIPVNEIFVDLSYQRDPTSTKGLRRVREIAEAFDPDSFGIIYLSKRDTGLYACMDGGHRIEVVRYFGEQWANDKVFCAVYENLSVAEEARIYNRMNQERKQPTPINLFNSRVVGNYPDAVELNQALQDAGVNLANDYVPIPGSFRAISQAERIQKAAGVEILRQAVSLLNSMWGKDYEEALSGQLVAGMAYLIYTNKDRIDLLRLRKQVENLTPNYVLGQARVYRESVKVQMMVAVASVMAYEYNHNLRTRRLPEIPRGGWPRGAAAVKINRDARRRNGSASPDYTAVEGRIPLDSELDDINRNGGIEPSSTR